MLFLPLRECGINLDINGQGNRGPETLASRLKSLKFVEDPVELARKVRFVPLYLRQAPIVR